MDRDSSATDANSDETRETIVRRLEPHNLLALSAFSVLLRFAWIFKTESVIIPAFMDSIAGAGHQSLRTKSAPHFLCTTFAIGSCEEVEFVRHCVRFGNVDAGGRRDLDHDCG